TGARNARRRDTGRRGAGRRRLNDAAPRLPNADDNRLALAATLAQRADLRYTPVGIAALECTLLHRSLQREAGGERWVECELHALAFGDVARSLSAVTVGSAIRCEG